jgi:hypothetical protein
MTVEICWLPTLRAFCEGWEIRNHAQKTVSLQHKKPSGLSAEG